MVLHPKSLRELPAMTHETSKSSPDLLTFSQFHRHILKNLTMLFLTIFSSASEKIGVGLKKKKKKKKKKKNSYFFYLISPGEG